MRQSLTSCQVTKDSQSTLELLRYILANWVKEQERIDAERAEAEASFKYKTFDMGDTIESQQNEEDKNLNSS